MAKRRETTLPEQLLELARDSGLTAYGLAHLSGVDKSGISRWLNGQSDLTLESAGRLAEALSVEPLRVSRRFRPPAKDKRPSTRAIVDAPLSEVCPGDLYADFPPEPEKTA